MRPAACFTVALLVIAVSAAPLAAQAESREITAWLSAGLGGGSIRGVSGVLHETVSVGSLEVIARQSDIGPFFSGGRGVMDRGFLVGKRTGGRRIFSAVAVGYGRANPYQKFGEGGRANLSPSVAALLYDVSMLANAVLPGVALAVSGAVGARQTSYLMTTVNVELGWFGVRRDAPVTDAMLH